MKTRWQWVGAGLLLAAPSWADVITVDDDGGADFTDLPPAVAAAEPGDTLFVAAGVYSGFTIDGKPLTVIGLEPGKVVVQGSSRVTNLVTPARVVLCQLDFERLALSANFGPVVLDTVRVFGKSPAPLSVGACSDVRTIGSQMDSNSSVGTDFSGARAMVLLDGVSRFEATECWIKGPSSSNSYGWSGIRVLGGSRLHLAASSAFGGKGADEFNGGPWLCFYPGYEGGNGARVEEAGFLRAAGLATDVIKGGMTGLPQCYSTQSCGLVALGAGTQGIWSGVTLDPESTQGGYDCEYDGGAVTQAATPDPWLERENTPLAGGQARFYAHGQPGDVVTLFVGRNAVVVPLPGVEVEQLTSQERSFELGAIGGSGVVSFAMTVPSSLPPGFCFFGQARILRQGLELRTNSVPIVLR